MNGLTLELECSMVSKVEEVHKSAFPIHDIGKMQFYKLAQWFPHMKVRECFI